MITEYDLKEAISELQGHRNPTSTDCIKLAAYYTILNNMSDSAYGETRSISDGQSYSRAEHPAISEYIQYDFTNAALAEQLNGCTADKAFALLDDLMNAVKVTNPELYRFAVRKLNE